MRIRNLLITSVCALSLCGGLWAQGACKVHMTAGTYVVTINGWVTVNQTPTVLPFSALGTMIFDDTGVGLGPVSLVVAGQMQPRGTPQINLTVAKDCTLTWTAQCGNGCVWSGSGTYSKNNREIDLLFEQTNGLPVTAIAVLKEF
jgi:hypothetical protein